MEGVVDEAVLDGVAVAFEAVDSDGRITASSFANASAFEITSSARVIA